MIKWLRSSFGSCALNLIATFVLAPAASMAAQPITQQVTDHRNDLGEIEKRASDFVHRSSGFVYPPKLAEMPARKTITYGPGDAAVSYSLGGGGNNDAWLDLYIYPATVSLGEEQVNVAGPILDYPQATAAAAPPGLATSPPGAVDGWYRATMRGVPVLTGYRLVRSGDWFIKARTTIPVSGGEAAMQRASAAVSAVPWTWRTNSSRTPAHVPPPVNPQVTGARRGERVTT